MQLRKIGQNVADMKNLHETPLFFFLLTEGSADKVEREGLRAV